MHLCGLALGDSFLMLEVLTTGSSWNLDDEMFQIAATRMTFPSDVLTGRNSACPHDVCVCVCVCVCVIFVFAMSFVSFCNSTIAALLSAGKWKV